jgi:nicotinamidase-related amidase
MHCWNIGCKDGPDIDPNYAVGMCFPESFQEAERIMSDYIRPAVDVARNNGILVCHVENEHIGQKHQKAQEDLDPPKIATRSNDPVVPGWAQFIHFRAHGKDYPNRPPYVSMDRAKILEPKPNEPYVYQTGQFDRILRRHGIENLIYSGFATDMCILRAPGGAETMLPLGYRTYLMRDATLGTEFPDTFNERLATSWGIRYFETHCGDSLTFNNFIEAVQNL